MWLTVLYTYHVCENTDNEHVLLPMHTHQIWEFEINCMDQNFI